MCDFNNVWVWGNPLFADGGSYAPFLDNEVNYVTLAMVTRQMFSRTRNAWLQELFRAELTTDKLIEAMRYYLEAEKQRIEPAPYLANRLQFDVPKVNRLLLFVDIPEVLAHSHLITTHSKPQKEYVYSRKYRAPTSHEIQKMMAYIKHPCAAGYDGCMGDIMGRFSICFNCYKTLGSHNEAEWDAITQKWLPAEIRRIRSQWQKDARAAWYKQQYTEISTTELDEPLYGDVQEYAVSGVGH